ncbi:MAG TPA: hypothetical protein VEB41_07985 [Burkholderiales bacterium]|nr:hypothetical protein [Burkholderiales bacterium]
MKRLLAVFLFTASCAHAQPQVWVNAGFLSWHIDRDRGFREDNWGLGGEVLFAPEHGATAGTFLNSEHQRSRYIGYQWRPAHWRPANLDLRGGVAFSLVDGYPGTRNGEVFFAPVPFLALEGRRIGANFLVLPNRRASAVAVQLKLRIW